MKTYKVFIVFLFLLMTFSGVMAQNTGKVSGRIISPFNNAPIKGAIVSVSGQNKSATTDSLGWFSLEVNPLKGQINVWAPGYYDAAQPILGTAPVNILMVPSDKFRYNRDMVMPFSSDALALKGGHVQNINQKDMAPAALSIEDVLGGNLTGLRLVNKSGMPGEGSYLNMRGVRSLVGNNSPLIILNGMPYLPDMNQSSIIGGYSSGILDAFNVNDIENISLLKGPDASMYGSMGANGVILIETKKATDFETNIEFSGQYGLAFNAKKLPLLKGSDFKSYIGDIGLTKYDDMGEMLSLFPFLKDDPTYYYKFLYNNNTDWQSQIYNTAFVSDNNLRVKGGDAVAKYDLSVGALSQNGVLKNTGMDRYNTRLNANIALSKKIELFSSFGFAYINSNLHEQGMLDATNPLLTAFYQAPILNPYKKDEYNHQLPAYDIVRQFNVSNPLAAVNTISMTSETYDVTVNTGINYQVNNNLKLSGSFGIYYNYNRQAAFVPGVSSGSIVALDDSVAKNTERAGVDRTHNYYYNLSSEYKKSFGIHSFSAGLGVQSLITEQEFDGGKGRNTASDFYQTLTNVTAEGRSFWGYINKWNWMNFNGFLGYDFNKQLFASANFSLDGSSSSGTGHSRYGFFPSGKLTWRVKNMSWLQNSSMLNQLDLHVGYGISGNSRFSSNLGKYYYSSQAYRTLSGIVSGGLTNPNLGWEDTYTASAGMEFSLFKNRLRGSVDLYKAISKNVIMSKPVSSVSGTGYVYDNVARISNKGLEIGLQAAVIDMKDFNFILGGTFNMNKSILESLGGVDEQITTLEDGSAIISKVGESPYSFYGYASEGVFSTQAEANAAGLTDYKGDKFNAGDIHFKDIHKDNVIDDKDRTIIGNANPDFFGGFYGNVRYKNISLSADFSYSVGNKTYNAVRRSLESMTNFYNQSEAVNRRWQTDGQTTDIPRSVYGDPMKNSRFSDRWIEDASYVRLANVTLSYSFNQKLFKLVRSGTVFVSGENLFTLTNYLGLDPVNSYSYDPMLQGFDYAKVALPRTVKFGIKLQF